MKESENIFGKCIAELESDILILTKESLLIIPKDSIAVMEPDLYPEEFSLEQVLSKLPISLQNWIQNIHEY